MHDYVSPLAGGIIAFVAVLFGILAIRIWKLTRRVDKLSKDEQELADWARSLNTDWRDDDGYEYRRYR